MRQRRVDLTGRTFGQVEILGFSHKNEAGNCYWNYRCSCGKESKTTATRLLSGQTQSCGCAGIRLRKELNTKHGQYDTRTYHTWEGMKQRCLNPNATRFPTYGAVGVKVCDRWMKFEAFLEDMGERPAGHTLDRIDPFGDYEPWNCRWATYKEQQNNQRRHKLTEEA